MEQLTFQIIRSVYNHMDPFKQVSRTEDAQFCVKSIPMKNLPVSFHACFTFAVKLLEHVGDNQVFRGG